jgi:hypothetical protein
MNSGDTGKKWLTTKQKAKEEQVCTKTILRRVEKGLYPGAYQLSPGGEWRFPANELPTESHKTITPVEIAVEETYRTAVIAHFEELREIARQWKAQLWLPPPWQWDVADLRQVFYEDRNKGLTGYKLPQELANGEKSRGHFRHIGEYIILWTLWEDGIVTLGLPVENETIFNYLKSHTSESPVWYLFTQWKRLGGIYIQYCSSLLSRISQDVQRAIIRESQQLSWVIYHDAFYTQDTASRCEKCGEQNSTGARFCRNCESHLGWLRPIITRFESPSDNSQKIPIHIHGWGNIEESVESGRFEGITRGIKFLEEKHRGGDLVEKILESEKESRLVYKELGKAIDMLSQQQAFNGQCKACPVKTKT